MSLSGGNSTWLRGRSRPRTSAPAPTRPVPARRCTPGVSLDPPHTLPPPALPQTLIRLTRADVQGSLERPGAAPPPLVVLPRSLWSRSIRAPQVKPRPNQEELGARTVNRPAGDRTIGEFLQLKLTNITNIGDWY